MHRFYVPEFARPAPFSGEQAQQIARVLRLRPGDRVELFDGRGRSAELLLEIVTPKAVAGTIVPGSERTVPWPLRARPVLYLALIRPQRFEWAIEKATELAAWRIVPLLTERAAHSGSELSESRLRRWRSIAIEAAEQCGSAYVPEIASPLALPDALHEPAALRLFASTASGDDGGERLPVRTAVRELPGGAVRAAGAAASSPDDLPETAVFVGPEGGFTDHELALAAGCRLVTLGPLTLRAETAALVALAALGEALRDTPNAE
ncbi:MAG TPA: RsmE family RNA methyltransferase [Dehalococcoidia bacterium]|nr:RsmE family RNA methyltransferase [Dehalococcoidia bacterium]